MVGLAGACIVNLFSLALLIIIYVHSAKQGKKESMQYKLFALMLQVIAIMLVFDILSRLDGNPDTIYFVLNVFGNFVIFLLGPVVPSIWLLYVVDQVFPAKGKNNALMIAVIALNAANAVLLILNQFYGWFYTIDAENIYHRGPYFIASALLSIGLLACVYAIIIVNRKRINKSHYFSLIFFAVPPVAGILLQVLFYGTSLMLCSIVLSILIVFLNIQNNNINTDYLTGVKNRKNLEIYMNQKISACSEEKTFSAIMLDLNNFKAINDTYGHDMGDRALQVSVQLLNSCLRANDFIARFGGDEFCIVLDVCNKDELESIVGRIRNCIKQYNDSCDQPYTLGFSMGYAVYDYYSGMTAEKFQKKIDVLMYENKKENKELLDRQFVIN